MIIFFFQAEDGIRDSDMWLEFRRVLFRSWDDGGTEEYGADNIPARVMWLRVVTKSYPSIIRLDHILDKRRQVFLANTGIVL